jgi:hypothetical protein
MLTLDIRRKHDIQCRQLWQDGKSHFGPQLDLPRTILDQGRESSFREEEGVSLEESYH